MQRTALQHLHILLSSIHLTSYCSTLTSVPRCGVLWCEDGSFVVFFTNGSSSIVHPTRITVPAREASSVMTGGDRLFPAVSIKGESCCLFNFGNKPFMLGQDQLKELLNWNVRRCSGLRGDTSLHTSS